MSDTMHYPPSRKYDVNEEYANAERELSEVLLDLASGDAVEFTEEIAQWKDTGWCKMYLSEVGSDDAAPTWQTEPPTEAGWYPAIMRYGEKVDVFYIDAGEYEGSVGKRMVHELVTDARRVNGTGGNLYVATYPLRAFSHWWPVPIMMPESPE